MGNMRAIAVAVLALAACGEDHAKPDAQIVIQDAPPIDMQVFEDAPPPNYDFTCFGMAEPTTADDPITLSGNTVELGQGGTTPVANVAVDVFDNGSATAIGTATSDATGAFTTGDITTGAVPIDGYVRAQEPAPNLEDPTSVPAHRTTFMYPASPVAASMANVPVLMMSNATFDQIAGFLGGQDDTTNGALFFVVTDCSDISTQTLVGDATVHVQQDGMDVGNLVGLDVLDPSLAGTYVVLNVPDGETQITASYDGMDYPTRTVVAHKKPAGDNAVGTLTFTIVRPGP